MTRYETRKLAAAQAKIATAKQYRARFAQNPRSFAKLSRILANAIQELEGLKKQM